MGAQALPADGNARIATAEPIALHYGLSGLGNLTTASAWSGPVLQVVIERARSWQRRGWRSDYAALALTTKIEPPTTGVAATAGVNGNTSTDPGEAPE